MSRISSYYIKSKLKDIMIISMRNLLPKGDWRTYEQQFSNRVSAIHIERAASHPYFHQKAGSS